MKRNSKHLDIQTAVCDKYGALRVGCADDAKIGISNSAMSGELPLHGLRHLPTGDTSGWYIWAGEYSDDPSFFLPLHIEHLPDICPDIIKFLGLAPGWRFLLGENSYEDVWYDPTLIVESRP